MGFYIRKSIKAGPFRFNFSKSGIGVSAGIKGLRVGAGPWGNYVHMGMNGIYYRHSLTSKPKSRPSEQSFTKTSPLQGDMSLDPFKDIESADISAMSDSSAAELLAEFDAKQKKWRLWPWVLIAGIGALFALPPGVPGWLITVILCVIMLGSYAVYLYDDTRKSVVLFYDLEPEVEQAYQAVHDAFLQLKSARRVWHVESHANVRDRKYHAGASEIVRKKPVGLSLSAPAFVKTNLSVPSIPVGRQILFFFPDRLLVFESNKVGAVSYDSLQIEINSTRFIEDGSVPPDSQVVDYTWRYVNKSGGPDRRFNNNRQLPICLYEDIYFKSAGGLNELVQFSCVSRGEIFASALSALTGNIRPGARISMVA